MIVSIRLTIRQWRIGEQVVQFSLSKGITPRLSRDQKRIAFVQRDRPGVNGQCDRRRRICLVRDEGYRQR